MLNHKPTINAYLEKIPSAIQYSMMSFDITVWIHIFLIIKFWCHTSVLTKGQNASASLKHCGSYSPRSDSPVQHFPLVKYIGQKYKVSTNILCANLDLSCELCGFTEETPGQHYRYKQVGYVWQLFVKIYAAKVCQSIEFWRVIVI